MKPMNTLSNRIQERLSALNKTQADLAKYCKIKPPSVSKWLNGSTKNLQGQNLLRASEFLECDPDWLASGKGFWAVKETDNTLSQMNKTSPYTISVLGGDILNRFIINTSDIQANITHIEYTEDQYRRIFSALSPDSVRLSNVKSDNMVGTLAQGDLVFIDITVNRYDGDGLYLFIVNNHLHLKRLQMVGSNLLVISDNKQYKNWEIMPSDKKSFAVVGKVLLGQSQIFQRF
jgi:predicted transcriptional regulator